MGQDLHGDSWTATTTAVAAAAATVASPPQPPGAAPSPPPAVAHQKCVFIPQAYAFRCIAQPKISALIFLRPTLHSNSHEWHRSKRDRLTDLPHVAGTGLRTHADAGRKKGVSGLGVSLLLVPFFCSLPVFPRLSARVVLLFSPRCCFLFFVPLVMTHVHPWNVLLMVVDDARKRS